MSEYSTPMGMVENSSRILEIIKETESQFNNEIKVTPGEAKRIELIRKMKQDTDKTEYMVMFNVLLVGVSLISIAHFAWFGIYGSLISLVFSIAYFVFVRRKLTWTTLQLMEYKDNFDKYLWEGYYLKEMRFTAVKLAYYIFFPLLMIFLIDIIHGQGGIISWWVAILVTSIISTIAWTIFFHADKDALESIESDLNSLKYL